MTFKSLGAVAGEFIGDPPPPDDLLDPPEPDDDIAEAMPTLDPPPPEDPPPPDPPRPRPTSVLMTPEMSSLTQVLAKMQIVNAAPMEHIQEVALRALAIKTIDDDPTEKKVGELIDILGDAETRIDAELGPIREAADKLHKAICAKVSEWKGRGPEARKYLRELLAKRLLWKADETARINREARERAQREQQARYEAEAKHLEATGEAPELVAAVREEARTAPPPPVHAPEAEAFRPAVNASTRKNWKAEVLDKGQIAAFVVLGQVPQGFKLANPQFLNLLDVNTTALNQLARSQEKGFSIPGARAFNDAALTKRRG